MRKQYMERRWTVPVLMVLLIIYLLPIRQALAQQDMISGVLRIKVSEELALQLENATMSRTSDDVLLTGIQSLDAANQEFRVKGLRRVFRPGGKFETRHRKYGLHRWYQVDLDKAASVLAAIEAYGAIEQVEHSEPVFKKVIIGSESPNFGPEPIVPEEFASRMESRTESRMATLPGASNDPLLESQWHYNNTGQTGGTPGADISLFQAWGIETGASDVIVAVTDGGIQVDHPDLAANMWVNTGEIPGNGVDDDGNGYIDDINGYGFGDDTGAIAPDAHGTHVGGTVAAVTNNGTGVAGVAGGSGVGDGARLMSCAAFGAVGIGGFPETYVYGADMGAVISQNSWGYTDTAIVEQAVLDAIDYFIAEAGKDELGNQTGPMNGGIVIFAAGNDNLDGPWYPGFYDATLAVSGTTHNDTKAWYSNFGTWVDIAAPGGETNTVAQEGVLSTLSNNQYGFFQGTSMACPHVSGVAALIVSRYGGSGFSPLSLRDRLVSTTDNIDLADPPFAGLLGVGRLNAFAALQSNDSIAPDPITDLSVLDVGITSISLVWTSPVDAGNGSASQYDIRYSTSPIDPGNFAAATPVASTPSPSNAGMLDSVKVTGLAAGTLYYFAIKSFDLFGNESGLSNVVAQATNEPPVIALSDTALTESLLTAETSVQSFSISNTGAGPLDFAFEQLGPDNFATFSVNYGTVLPGSVQIIDVTFDASGLFTGTYEQHFMVHSNDPVNDSILFTLTLNVTSNGAPIASFDPSDSLGFGSIFVGASTSQSVAVSNAGSETLMLFAALSDHPAFTSFTDTVAVAPFETYHLEVAFSPDSLGPVQGILTIHTSDPADPDHELQLFGEGIPTPDIEVSPNALTETLFTDNTSTQTLTISNTGDSDLEFAIETSSNAGDSLSMMQVQLPETVLAGVGLSTAAGKATASASIQRKSRVEIKWISQSAASTSVLILTPDTDVTQLAALLNGFPDVTADIFPRDSLPFVGLSQLLAYDMVMTTNNTQWLAAGGIDPAAVGDLLADYVDAGGKVIVNQFAYSYDAWQMQGRFIDENYGPFTPATSDAQVDVSLGSILAPSHPIIQGVTTLDYSGFVQNVGLAPNGTAIANWSDGELFLAANDDVVALNILSDLGDGNPFQWEGDLALIYHNAIQYLSGPSFLDFSLTEGTLTPGESVNVDVLFDATGLDAGLYTASIDISSNVPGKELIAVPASLTVLGPEFTVSPDSFEEVLEKNETSTRTLTLTNHGDGIHPFSVNVAGGRSVSALSIQRTTSSPSAARTVSGAPRSVATRTEATLAEISMTGVSAIAHEGTKTAREKRTLRTTAAVPEQQAIQYATGFEEFAPGDIHGQNGWLAQFGNWTVESTNAWEGSQHFRGLADGFGQSLAFTPNAGIGTDPRSSASMYVNVTGTDVTWQLIPQSPTASLVVTRIQFSPDGVARALVSDGAGGGVLVDIPAAVPSGYFELTLEVVRATAEFVLSFDGTEVFTGQGFTGDIEEFAILSLMEVAGPTLDIDNFKIIDGPAVALPEFVTVAPLTGTLGAGESVDLTVTFNSADLEFGRYVSDISIDISDEEFVVPAFLHVVGDPQIAVDPTVVQAVVPYKGDTVHLVNVKNTGGNPLTYSMQVIGADTDVASLPASPQKRLDWKTDSRIQEKLAAEARAYPERQGREDDQPQAIQLLAGAELFSESFEGGSFPPAGWSVVDNEGTGVVWSFAADHGEGNYSGTGEAATVSSDDAGVVEYDTELITPLISTAGFKNIAVQYNANYFNLSTDILDLDIQVNGDSTWTNVLNWNEDHGTFFGTPGEQVIVELDDYLSGASSFRLRWHYYNPDTDDWDWYAQIDDVVILGDPKVWLTMEPASGTVPVGEDLDVEARFDAEDIEAGFYVAGAIITSNAANTPVVGLLASLEVLEPAEISVAPDSIYEKLMVGESTTRTITISNSGESPLAYSFNGILPAAASAKPRIPAGEPRTTPVPPTAMSTDGKAILHDGKSLLLATTVYGTGFEEFAPGDIDEQEGWVGQFGNWTVESLNAFEGGQHFRGLADGLGQSLAFSPNVGIGSEAVSSVTMMMNVVGTGATWQIIPQSTTAELVITRFAINPDLSVEVLVADSLGGGAFVPLPVSLPAGYFELRIDVERATSVFTIYFDQVPVFTGQGFAGDIEEVAVFSLMEVSGPTLDLDNFSIWDGEPQKPWLVLSPMSGVVPAGGSAEVSVLLDASELEKGTYSDVLSLISNDPLTPQVNIPVVLEVDQNLPPELAVVPDTSVVELGSIDLYFTATDPDDSLLSVTLLDAPAFVTLAEQGNGYSQYTVDPQIGDAGEYGLTVLAEDGRGMTDSAYFVLTVVPYGVSSFSLINGHTGEVVTTFTESVTLDVNDPDYFSYIIQGNTTPETVGSVKFKVDGRTRNTDSHAPYRMVPVAFLGLDGGAHTLGVTAYTGRYGRGQAGQEKTATIHVTSSTQVTGVQVVNLFGEEQMALGDSSVIDISDPAFCYINLTATTAGPATKVEFVLNGKTEGVDYFAPYSMAGDFFGFFGRWRPEPGQYTLTVTPYSGLYPIVAGQSLTVHFEVVDGSATARMAGDEGGAEENVPMTVTLYPVPATSEVSIQASGIGAGDAELLLVNLQGQVLYHESLSAASLRDKKLQLDELKLSSGVYYLKVRTQELNITREIIKQ